MSLPGHAIGPTFLRTTKPPREHGHLIAALSQREKEAST
jgi:hypothetical protein